MESSLWLELLPEPQELIYSGSSDAGDALSSSIDARQNAGCPIALVRHNPGRSPSELSFKFEPPAITLASDDAGKNVDLNLALTANHQAVHLCNGRYLPVDVYVASATRLTNFEPAREVVT